jgi:uncharacterized RDD family membrane protein YckC
MTGTGAVEQAAEGVYFSPRDSAGVWRRLVCGLIDVGVLWVLLVALLVGWSVLSLPREFAGLSLAAAWMLTCFGYLAVLKQSRLGTVGDRATGLKVVDLRGGRPSLTRMTVRCGLLLLGTGFILIDLLCVLGTRRRQKLSDVIAGTYVVRSGATPEGRGRVVLAIHCVFGYFFVHEAVRETVRA